MVTRVLSMRYAISNALAVRKRNKKGRIIDEK
jgi:hypothetical protein